MDKHIPHLYKEYGAYVNRLRAFPSNLDGLKPVERRILYSTYRVAYNKFVKCTLIDGENMGHFHPHGSAYPTIVQLVQRGMLDGQGAFGTNVGIEPLGAAAPRYCEAKLSEFAKNDILSLIDCVPKKLIEIEEEPTFLPTKYPLCFIGTKDTGSVIGIGFAHRTVIPVFDKEDLKKRLFYLIGKSKKKPIIRPLTHCEIISTDEELDELLTLGKASIKMRGVITSDNKEFKIYLHSWPETKTFSSILKAIQSELDAEEVGFKDASSDKTLVEFKILKQRNRQEVFDNVLRKLSDVVVGSINYSIKVTDEDDNIISPSVDELLITCFNNYVDLSTKILEKNISDIESKINEILLIDKIKPSLKKNFNVDYDVAVINISKDTKIDRIQIENILEKYKIKKLLTYNTDISILQNEILKYRENLEHIAEYVLNEY